MLKKARSLLKVSSVFGFDGILGTKSEYIEFSLDEFVATILLATYYCHNQEVVTKLIKTMLMVYPDCLRTDKVLHGYNPEVVNSWFSLQAMLFSSEKMTSETDLEKVTYLLKAECLK